MALTKRIGLFQPGQFAVKIYCQRPAERSIKRQQAGDPVFLRKNLLQVSLALIPEFGPLERFDRDSATGKNNNEERVVKFSCNHIHFT